MKRNNWMCYTSSVEFTSTLNQQKAKWNTPCDVIESCWDERVQKTKHRFKRKRKRFFSPSQQHDAKQENHLLVIILKQLTNTRNETMEKILKSAFALCFCFVLCLCFHRIFFGFSIEIFLSSSMFPTMPSLDFH